MLSRLCAVLLAGALTPALLAPGTALADAGVVKEHVPESFSGTMPLPSFLANCVGAGTLHEQRSGSYAITTHTTGAREATFHVVGTVDATITIDTEDGPTLSGSYREHVAGTLGDQDAPAPAVMFVLHGTAADDGGVAVRFRLAGHTVIDRRTGEVRRDVQTGTCSPTGSSGG